MAEDLKEITVVIPQHNCWFETVACCSSLWRHHQEKFRIVIVDDGSDAKNRGYAKKYLNARVTILTQKHSGVTAAWNRGVAAVDSRFIVLLNNDVMTLGAWLPEMQTLLKRNEHGLAGAALRCEKMLAKNLRRHCPHGDATILEGWCLGFSKTTFEIVGCFDESLKLYWSDTDWQLRWLQLFNRNSQDLCLLTPGRIRHRGHQSTRWLSESAQWWKEDRERFLLKWQKAKHEFATVR